MLPPGVHTGRSALGKSDLPGHERYVREVRDRVETNKAGRGSDSGSRMSQESQGSHSGIALPIHSTQGRGRNERTIEEHPEAVHPKRNDSPHEAEIYDSDEERQGREEDDLVVGARSSVVFATGGARAAASTQGGRMSAGARASAVVRAGLKDAQPQASVTLSRKGLPTGKVPWALVR